jgi:hypothetical protein
MAFNNTSKQATLNNGPSNNNWKATAFLNLYLPDKDGGRRKVGFVALKENRSIDRQLIEFLQADEGNVEVLLGKLQLEFNMADGSDSSALALD